MKHVILAIILLSATGIVTAQNRVPVPVKDTTQPPAKDTTISKVSDLEEVVISSTPG
ncbi:hypothetical protein QFZ48_000405 [Chitinophaga sp. W2I13]|uniref:hypothetical protein n=1 Tax=Chitinophaga sp. W2I13 TaxID=3373923 RepID=UPI003D1BE0B8